MDYRAADLVIKARLKAEEERINNDILTGAKTALKVVQFYSGSNKASDIQYVNFNIDLSSNDAQNNDFTAKDLENLRSQYDFMIAHGFNIKSILIQKEREALNGRQ